MFKRVVSGMARAQLRSFEAKGGLACPVCAAIQPAAQGGPDEILTCVECGHFAPVYEWINANNGGRRLGRVGNPPPNTHIVRETTPDGGSVWYLPPSGRSGGVTFFGWVWIAFIAAFTALLTYGLIHGIDSDSSPAVTALLFTVVPIPFWAIGIAILRSGYRAKNGRHSVLFTEDRITLTFAWRGKRKQTSVLREEVQSIEQVLLNTKTLSFGVQIKGQKDHLQFGGSLTEAERAWLVAEFKAIVWPEVVPVPITRKKVPIIQDEPPVSSERRDRFVLALPKKDGHPSFGIVLAIFTAGMLWVMSEFWHYSPMDLSGPGVFKAFDFVFYVVGNGVRLFALIFFVALFALGIHMIVLPFCNRDVERFLEGTPESLILRKSRRGLTLSKKVYDRSTYLDIRSAMSSATGTKVLKRVNLLIENKAETLASDMLATEADAFVQEAKRLI